MRPISHSIRVNPRGLELVEARVGHIVGLGRLVRHT